MVLLFGVDRERLHEPVVRRVGVLVVARAGAGGGRGAADAFARALLEALGVELELEIRQFGKVLEEPEWGPDLHQDLLARAAQKRECLQAGLLDSLDDDLRVGIENTGDNLGVAGGTVLGGRRACQRALRFLEFAVEDNDEVVAVGRFIDVRVSGWRRRGSVRGGVASVHRGIVELN